MMRWWKRGKWERERERVRRLFNPSKTPDSSETTLLELKLKNEGKEWRKKWMEERVRRRVRRGIGDLWDWRKHQPPNHSVLWIENSWKWERMKDNHNHQLKINQSINKQRSQNRPCAWCQVINKTFPGWTACKREGINVIAQTTWMKLPSLVQWTKTGNSVTKCLCVICWNNNHHHHHNHSHNH